MSLPLASPTWAHSGGPSSFRSLNQPQAQQQQPQRLPSPPSLRSVDSWNPSIENGMRREESFQGMVGVMKGNGSGQSAAEKRRSLDGWRRSGDFSAPPGDALEDALRRSPLILGLLDRISRTESTLQVLTQQMASVNTSLATLLPSTHISMGTGETQTPTPPTPLGNTTAPLESEGLKAMADQMSALSTSVAQLQLMAAQQKVKEQQSGFNLTMPPTSAKTQPPTPSQQSSLQNPFPLQAPQALQSQQGGKPSLNLSRPSSVVRPGNMRSFTAGYIPNDRPSSAGTMIGVPPDTKRRPPLGEGISIDNNNFSGGWPTPAAGPQTPGGSSHIPVKWDQLNITPSLLHAIIKYGIGPPNKVQQRALPFLLRGSDIIAQAPPTQERIISYVVPALNVCLSIPRDNTPYKGPYVVVITTTVDQATQAHKLVRDIGTHLGIRSTLSVGSGGDVPRELGQITQHAPQVLCGTPAKIHDLFTRTGGLSGEGVRFLVIDEVDQLIARNLYEFVIEVVKRFPSPRANRAGGAPLPSPAAVPQSPFDAGVNSPFNPSSGSPFPSTSRRFPVAAAPVGAIGSKEPPLEPPRPGTVDRQTCLFSNTVPQDVLNFSNAIQVREPVRVLVRREGGGAEAPNNAQGGAGLKHLYLYLAFTGGSRSVDNGASTLSGNGSGVIGSGRGLSVNSETTQAKEWKLEALADLLEEEVLPALVHVGSAATMESVVYKLTSRNIDATFLHSEMSPSTRQAALTKFRNSTERTRVLVIFDLIVKPAEVNYVRLVVNYDLPRSVEGYAQRVSPAVSATTRPGLIVNLIQASGGDVEMMRSIECAYKFKCSEVPMSLKEAL